MSFDQLLIDNPEVHFVLLLSFWICTIGSVAMTTLRRSFFDTASGHFHPVFREMNVASDFDESEKLQRVGVVLTVTAQFLRISWVMLWATARVGSGPEYLPQAWNEHFAVRLLCCGVELLLLTVVLHELLPQVVATWRGRAMIMRLLPILCRLETPISPLTISFRWLRSALLRFVGNGAEQSEADLAEEGLRAAVEVGERQGLLRPGEKSMIESVLDFHEGEIVEVMTPRTDMVCLEGSTTLEAAVDCAIECGHSRMPVFTGDIDNIVGVLYVKDLLRYGLVQSEWQQPIEKMIRKINFVPETKKIQNLLTEFRAHRFHIAVVLDEYGGTSGLVTIEDILEEIVGEIEDEFDSKGMQLVRRIDGRTFELDGRAPIDEVNVLTGAELPESDDYETIAGFLMAELGCVPQQGDELDFKCFRFHVTAADERKVKLIRARQVREAPAEV